MASLDANAWLRSLESDEFSDLVVNCQGMEKLLAAQAAAGAVSHVPPNFHSLRSKQTPSTFIQLDTHPSPPRQYPSEFLYTIKSPDTMADNQHDIRPQPDLALCSQSLHNLAREAEKLQNLPAFDASNQLSLAVNRLTQLVNEKFDALDEKFDALNKKFDGMKTQISVKYVYLFIFEIAS